MPILLAGEGVASDCFAGVGADVGLLAGGDWARSGVAKHNVATTRRGLTMNVSLRDDSGLAEAEPVDPCTVKSMMVLDRTAVC